MRRGLQQRAGHAITMRYQQRDEPSQHNRRYDEITRSTFVPSGNRTFLRKQSKHIEIMLTPTKGMATAAYHRGSGCDRLNDGLRGTSGRNHKEGCALGPANEANVATPTCHPTGTSPISNASALLFSTATEVAESTTALVGTPNVPCMIPNRSESLAQAVASFFVRPNGRASDSVANTLRRVPYCVEGERGRNSLRN
jgi:hypothetical protein